VERRPKRQPRPEIEVENQPELVVINRGAKHELAVPTSWPEERRAANYLLWMRLR